MWSASGTCLGTTAKKIKPEGSVKYDLVVIDSLDGCNDSNPYEENRREYALPLKSLRGAMVRIWGRTIIVIHNNRNGSFRGTSAIRAAVDETWNMQKGAKKNWPKQICNSVRA